MNLGNLMFGFQGTRMYRFALLVALLFIAAAAPAAAQTLTIVGGDGQRLARVGSETEGGKAKFTPLSIALHDAAGKGIANAPITFRCNHTRAMACQFTPSGSENGTLTINTDGNGVATLNRMGGNALEAYYADGGFTVTASYRHLNVTFHLALDPDAGPRFSYFAKVVRGDNQRAPRVGEEPYGGTAHFGPITIQVVDANGRPASGIRIWYRCINAACNLGSPQNDATDGNGHYTLLSVDEYYGAGGFAVEFVGERLQAVQAHLVSFDQPRSTSPLVKGAKLTVVAGGNQHVPRSGNQVPGGVAKFAPMAVRLVGPDGKPVANAPIHFNCGRNVNWACQLTPSGAENGQMDIYTDGNGVATLNKMGGNALEFYYAAGPRQVHVTYGNIASVTIHFTVTR
jgi:hypothetical protein